MRAIHLEVNLVWRGPLEAMRPAYPMLELLFPSGS